MKNCLLYHKWFKIYGNISIGANYFFTYRKGHVGSNHTNINKVPPSNVKLSNVTDWQALLELISGQTSTGGWKDGQTNFCVELVIEVS